MEVRLLTVAEAAKRQGVSAQAVREAILSHPKLMAAIVGGRWMVVEATLDAWKPRNYPRKRPLEGSHLCVATRGKRKMEAAP